MSSLRLGECVDSCCTRLLCVLSIGREDISLWELSSRIDVAERNNLMGSLGRYPVLPNDLQATFVDCLGEVKERRYMLLLGSNE